MGFDWEYLLNADGEDLQAAYDNLCWEAPDYHYTDDYWDDEPSIWSAPPDPVPEELRGTCAAGEIILATSAPFQGCIARAGESDAPFVTGIFLDISQLWERFLLEKVLPPSSERHYQVENRILGGNLRVFPDFYYETGSFYRGSLGVILDAKYKFKWGNTLNGGRTWTGVHDGIYQVLAYMLELRCPQGGVVFPVDRTALPQTVEASFLEKLRIPIGAGPEGRLDHPPFQFWRFPFAVPGEVSDYSAFRRSMDQEAEWLGSQIAGLLFQPRRA